MHTTLAPSPSLAENAKTLPVQRLVSLDAYRGLAMFLMMAEVLRLSSVAAARPGNRIWSFLAHHQSHVEWIGCSLHDLIQPSFSFVVGVALPFSLASRMARGQSRGKLFLHALWRSLVLILLGVFLRSIGREHTVWTFEDTLTQIGLGYPFLFLLALRPRREQWIAFAVILIGYWAAFALYPLPGASFDYPKVGVAANWPHLMSGFQAHWNKNSNLAWAFDHWFIPHFPYRDPNDYNGGGYATLNFIPTLATMILGLLAGQVMRSEREWRSKVSWLLVASAIAFISGIAIHQLGICPIVKRIWTPSWVLFSGGWCFVLLAGFYFIIDVLKLRRWAFVLTVIGMNSIAAYLLAHLVQGFVAENLTRHLGQNIFKVFGDAYQPLVFGATVLCILWLMLLWMYRKRIFLRI